MEFSGDLRKNEEKNNKTVPCQILSVEQRQSLPVNIQPMVSLALIKIREQDKRSISFQNTYIFAFFQWLDACTGEARVCRGIWMD